LFGFRLIGKYSFLILFSLEKLIIKVYYKLDNVWFWFQLSIGGAFINLFEDCEEKYIGQW
jgi:hypothetical protein